MTLEMPHKRILNLCFTMVPGRFEATLKNRYPPSKKISQAEGSFFLGVEKWAETLVNHRLWVLLSSINAKIFGPRPFEFRDPWGGPLK